MERRDDLIPKLAEMDRPGAPTLSDAELVRGCLRGSEVAWGQLLGRYQRLIYSIPVRMGLTPDECSDVFQGVCSILLEKLETLRDPKMLSSWIMTTTRREALRVRRVGRREVPLPETEDGEPGDWAQVEVRIEQDLLAVEREHNLRLAWERLDDRCRTILEALFFGPDQDYKRLSKLLDMPIGSIGPTRMRCLAHLRRELQRLGM